MWAMTESAGSLTLAQPDLTAKPPTPTFSIVVPTFRRPDTLRKTLTALVELDYPADRYEVIVVDDAADDITARIIDELPDRGIGLKLEAQHRRGAASARNRGARAANGDWVLFCDDDILAPPSHLLQHLATHQRHDGAAVAGNWELAPELVTELWLTPFGRYRMEVERRFLAEARGDPLTGDHHLLQMPLVAAADLSLRRELFWQIGGFDEEFPLAGAEDQDLSLRARAAGAVLLLDTSIHCFHHDHYLSLEAYCEREERNARTMSFMVRKHPAGFGDVPYARENRPIEASDPPKLVAKKLLKALLASEPMLEVLHRITRGCEELRAPEPCLRRMYAALLGLHLFRGFRHSWRT